MSKRKNVKMLALLLILAMSMTILAGCAKKEDNGVKEETSAEGIYKAGTYTGEAKGHNGNVKVSVTVDENAITKVEVVEHVETESLVEAALTRIPEKIVSGQTLAVDIVTGATFTSNAILAAVEAALEAAGGDITALKEKVEDKSSAETITYDTEVLVVGAGAAGLSAALEAANEGAEVMVIEKLSVTGGSTARSGGKIQAAGTDIQKENGVEDNADLYYEYLMEMGEGKTDPVKTRIVADTSLENFNWLIENGVEFSKTIEELHESRRPIRGHFVSAQDGKVEQDGHGWAITQPLEAKAKEAGVEILFETPGEKLLQDDQGNIVGIECTNADGNKVVINAKAVILATGGYDNNKELLAEYAPLVKPVHSTVATGNVGDGLIMAREVGAEIVSGGGAVMLYLDLAARVGENGGLYVDTTGSRFMDETGFWFNRTKHLLDREQMGMFYITDKAGALDNFGPLVESGAIFKAESVEELADQLKMPELVATVNRYNDLAKAGKDEDFGKKAEFMKPVVEGPYYAIPYLPITSGTFGGPLTNEKAQVINTDGNVIKGLYAAGEVANGDVFHKEYPGSGSSISMCIAFGRISGNEAAREAISMR